MLRHEKQVVNGMRYELGQRTLVPEQVAPLREKG